MKKLSIKNNYDSIKIKDSDKFFIVESFDNINFDIIFFENEKSNFIKTIEANDDKTLNMKFEIIFKSMSTKLWFFKEEKNDRTQYTTTR